MRTVEDNKATTVVTDYAYDAADQLVTQAVDGVASVTNTWTDNGALATSTTPSGTRTYVTDLTDELVSLTLEDDTTVDYTHDASGNRTSRSIDGVLDASWAWDDLSALPMRIGEYDSTGTLTTSWLADPTSATGASLAQTTNGVSSWLLSDPFANTVATVTTNGTTLSGMRTMDAFGVERLPATGALADAAVGFAGQFAVGGAIALWGWGMLVQEATGDCSIEIVQHRNSGGGNTEPPTASSSGGSTSLSPAAKRQLGSLAGRADETVASVIKSRGRGASQINQLETGYGQMKLSEVAQRAANGDPQAVKALKMVKQAGTQGKGGK